MFYDKIGREEREEGSENPRRGMGECDVCRTTSEREYDACFL